MTDLERDLNALFQAKADATLLTTPPLDRIVAEGRAAAARHHRHLGLIAAAAVAAVIAAIAIPIGVLHATNSAPVGPSHHPSSPSAPRTSEAQQIMDAAKVPYATAVATNGEIASLWSSCGGGGCAYAWSLTSPSASRGWSGVIPTDPGDGDSGEQLVDAGVGFIVASYSGSWPGTNFVLHNDGSTTPLRRTHSLTPYPMDPSLDAYPVFHGDGNLWVASAAFGEWEPYLRSHAKGELYPALKGAETLWVPRTPGGIGGAGARPEISWRALSGSWHSHQLLTRNPYDNPDIFAGPVATSGTRLVAATSEVAADDRDLLVGLSVSRDGGKTWTDIPGASLPFLDSGVSSGSPPPHTKPVVDIFDMAATVDGTLFIDTWNGHLFRSTDDTWTHFTQVRGVTGAADLQPLGNDSVVVTEETPGSVALTRFKGDGASTPLVQFSHGREASASPTPSTRPQAGPPTVPYVEGGTLYVHGKPVAKGFTGAVAAGPTVLGLADTGKGIGVTNMRVSLVENGIATRVPALDQLDIGMHDDLGPPVLSPDGRFAVSMGYTTSTKIPYTVRITEWSVTHHRVLGRVTVPDRAAPGGIQQIGLDDDGTLYYRDLGAKHDYAWSPGSAPRALTASESAAVSHGHLVVTPSGPAVIEDDACSVWGLSPDGTQVLCGNTAGTRYSVESLDGEHQVTLRLPEPAYQTVGFESEHAVLLTVGPRQHGPLVRCSTTSGACRRILDSTSGMTFARLLDWP